MPITKKDVPGEPKFQIVLIDILAYPDYKLAKVDHFAYMIYKRNQTGQFVEYLPLRFSEVYAGVMAVTAIEEFKKSYAIPVFNNLKTELEKLKAEHKQLELLINSTYGTNTVEKDMYIAKQDDNATTTTT